MPHSLFTFAHKITFVILPHVTFGTLRFAASVMRAIGLRPRLRLIAARSRRGSGSRGLRPAAKVIVHVLMQIFHGLRSAGKLRWPAVVMMLMRVRAIVMPRSHNAPRLLLASLLFGFFLFCHLPEKSGPARDPPAPVCSTEEET